MKPKNTKYFYTVEIEATVKAKSITEARNFLIDLVSSSKRVTSAGMTDLDINKMEQKKECPTKYSRFWGDSIEHDWGYITDKHRKCLNCGEEQMITSRESGYNVWSKKYIKSK